MESYLYKPTRNRASKWLRNLLAENTLEAADLIWPVFIVDGYNIKQEIKTMPGVYRYSVDQAIIEIAKAIEYKIQAVALFPVIEKKYKSSQAEYAFSKENYFFDAIKTIKDKFADQIGIICDIALDPYTDHGHDGVIINNKLDMSKSSALLAQYAILANKAGADILANSDMFDDTTFQIRQALSKDDVPILAYAKFASNFYGPFRDAVGSREGLLEADKNNYQMNYKNSKEIFNQIDHIINQGADMAIIKPGLPYLDIIKLISQNYNLPIFAYQVSGEYSAIKYAALNGCFDFYKSMYESLIAFKRAGASAIFTYAAIDIAEKLQY